MIFDRIARADAVDAGRDDWDASPARPPGRSFPGWKPSLIVVVTIAAIVGVLICLLVPTGDYDGAPRFTPLVPNAGDGFAAVAGEYDQGDGLGMNLRLSILPDGRYSFVWRGCLGVYGRESGRVRDAGGNLTLSPAEQTLKSPIARVLAPVKWGRRSYLIPLEQLREFCDAIVDGDEPREGAHGRFYAFGPGDQAVGFPDLPAPWSTYLRERAVLGSIVEVAEDGRARIDAGSADGLRVGSVLTVQGHGEHSRNRKLRVVSVDDHACRAEQGGPGEFKTPLKAGWNVVAAREPQAAPDR